MNPYDPPKTEVGADSVAAESKAKTNFRSLLIPTFVGAVVGSVVLAPVTRGTGDSTGRGSGFGLGGLLALFCAIIVRAVIRSNRSAANTSAIKSDEQDV